MKIYLIYPDIYKDILKNFINLIFRNKFGWAYTNYQPAQILLSCTIPQWITYPNESCLL